MRCLGKISVPGIVVGAFWISLAAIVGAEQPIRIGASASQTGAYGLLGQNQLRGYQLCVKHTNEKGGVLGRKLNLVVEDDQSETATAARIYEKLISRDRVDAILGPYSSPITEVVADLTEKYGMPMVSAGAASASIFRKGRKFLFMTASPAEAYLSGLIDMAHTRGLKTIAIIHEDTLFPKSIARGALEQAKKRGLQVVHFEAYPKGTTDFASVLEKIQAANPNVLAAATYFDDAVAITRRMKKMDVNPRMFGATSGVDLPRFYEVLGRTAEFVYGGSKWEPELVSLRAGGLIPIARQYPGAREFIESHRKEFPGTDDPTYHTAEGYAACQILVEAVKRAGSLASGKLRETILKLEINTVFGAFKVDRDGFQIGHRMLMFQWQDGRKVIVWPDELAPGKPRFPTPPWKERP
jgi:branched-chain amino acid transport system substrate-binding protein